MSRFAVVLIASLAFLGVTVSAQEGQTFTGEITDTHCAMLGSHDMMKKAEGFKSDLECVLYCVKYQKSGKYVLLDPQTKTIYQLDDQEVVEPYAAEKVKLTGTLDAAKKTIHVTGIQWSS
jgi:hypothetical protein